MMADMLKKVRDLMNKKTDAKVRWGQLIKSCQRDFIFILSLSAAFAGTKKSQGYLQ